MKQRTGFKNLKSTAIKALIGAIFLSIGYMAINQYVLNGYLKRLYRYQQQSYEDLANSFLISTNGMTQQQIIESIQKATKTSEIKNQENCIVISGLLLKFDGNKLTHVSKAYGEPISAINEICAAQPR